MVPHDGHVGQCDQQACRRSTLRVLRRMAGGSLWPAPADDGGHPDGWRRARWPGQRVGGLDVLCLLPVQCDRVRLRRTAAESGPAVAPVRSRQGPRDGRRLSRHWRRRRSRADSVELVDRADRLARKSRDAGCVDRRVGAAARVDGAGGALDALRARRASRKGGRGRRR